MSKPAAGKIYYDSTADRPRVDLRVGSRKLLTEDDSTGGAVSDVTSGSSAIDITPTTGNVVVSLDETELENGGGQEISIAGLSGQAADGQRASALITTGADVVVSGAAPGVAGQVLTLTGATAAAWQGAAGDPHFFYHVAPASAHADSDEFTSASLNARWTVIKDSARTTAVVPAGPVSGTGGASGTGINVSNNHRGTNFAWQGENGGIIRSISSLPAVTQLRFRCSVGWRLSGGMAGDACLFFGERVAGVPDLTNNFIRLGLSSGSGPSGAGCLRVFAQRTQAGGANTVATPEMMASPNLEFIVVVSADATNTTCVLYARGGPGSPSVLLDGACGNSSNFGLGRAAYIYLRNITSSALHPPATTVDNIATWDYVRVRDDWDLEAY